MGLKIEVPVFAETNLGTRIAVAVSPDITSGEFKRELERVHIECFPGLGTLTVDSVMVKEKSNFYRLSDLLPLKHAFQGCRKVWFVHVDMCLPNELEKFFVPKCTRSAEVNITYSNIKSKNKKLRVTWCLKALRQGLVAAAYPSRKKKKKRKRRNILKKFPAKKSRERLDLECFGPYGLISDVPKREGNSQPEKLHVMQVWDSNATDDTPCDSLSEAISISGIIDRYFSNLVELDRIGSPSSSEVATIADGENTSSCVLSTNTRHSLCKKTQRLLPEDPISVSLRNKYGRSEVGERLVMASNSVRLCQSKQRSERSNISKHKRLWDPDVSSIARSLVFEIGGDD